MLRANGAAANYDSAGDANERANGESRYSSAQNAVIPIFAATRILNST